jgi:peptidoglycan hydrolase CwlO-like protein
MLLYVLAERRKEDAEYFKSRMAALETRMNNVDKRMDTYDTRLNDINNSIKEISTLTIQINAHTIENSKRLEDLLNPPKPLSKKGKPKSAFKPEPLYTPPIQGPTPVPPPMRKTPYAIEGKQ